MATTHNWAGKRQSYTYCIHKLGIKFQQYQYGNFILAKFENDKWTPLYIGEGDLQDEINLLKDRISFKQLGATHIHAHLNQFTDNRVFENADLNEKYKLEQLVKAS